MKEQTLIGGKTLNEIANMPMLETRKFMHQHGHDWFGNDKKEPTDGNEKEKLFSVRLEYPVTEHHETEVQVYAKTKEEAEELAIEQLCEEEWDLSSDDVEVNGVEEIER